MIIDYNKGKLYNETLILLHEIKSIITEIYPEDINLSAKLYYDSSDRDMFSKYECDECIVIDIHHNKIHCVISLCLASESPIFNIETVAIPLEFQRKGYCTKIIQKIINFINKNNLKKYLIIADRSEEFIDHSGKCTSVWERIFSKFPELEVDYL